MAHRYDVIVLGCGVMGAAAGAQFARRGARTLILDRAAIPGAHGSSHGLSRFFRTAYFERDEYVPLLQRAGAGWRRLETESGRELLRRTGALYLGARRPGGFIDRTLAAARRFALPCELLDAAQLRTRFEQFTCPESCIGLLERDAGCLLPEAAVAAFAEVALRHSAEVRAHVAVHAWRASAREVRLDTSAGEFAAEHLVVCAGPWTAAVCADLGVTLTVTRQVAAWFWPRRPELFDRKRLPAWAIEFDAGAGPVIQYGFGLQPEAPGVKTALHLPGPPIDPDDRDRLQPRPDDAESLRVALQRFLPEANGPLLALRPCLYTNSPDGHFILGRHPAHDRVTIACGFSGHGFKFAPVIGEALADLALDGRTDLPVEFMAPTRFSA
ncbi:MAG: N-methyl-L-tryptophan oxidase [Phycisphaerales bacterium JB039]